MHSSTNGLVIPRAHSLMCVVGRDDPTAVVGAVGIPGDVRPVGIYRQACAHGLMQSRTASRPGNLDVTGLLGHVGTLAQGRLRVAGDLVQWPTGFRRDDFRRRACANTCLNLSRAQRLQSDLPIRNSRNLPRAAGLSR